MRCSISWNSTFNPILNTNTHPLNLNLALHFSSLSCSSSSSSSNLNLASTQVSFALRDLLSRAPIWEAAKHQANYEHLSLRTNATSFIEPSKCLNRFESANSQAANSPPNREFFQEKQIEYQVSDLMLSAEHRQLEGLLFGEPPSKVKLSESLELEVAPSGVRAIRLDELGAV